ncbi:hypothetical protein G6F26_013691 [Rhizopus arrhizus]|nr:hypothetical protein G6F27_013701 [Rhizopus arrhizus]KAG1008880.1 hypothetical protein G6F26_013691 [Rhizopus arrhizus]KAG1392789.1 hypothetical protein G6F59_014510 [Rhizopus arrhizus]
MEIPTKISTARTMVNYSSASNGLSRFLVCSACRSVYTSGSLHSRSCGYVRFPNNPYRQAQPCGNALFTGSSLKPVLEYPYNSITETLKKFFMRPSFEQQIEQWRRRSVDEDVMFDIYDGRVWNQLVDSNGQVFTSQPRSLMVSLNVDWFQPSDNMKHSSGAIYLAINNLPRNTRTVGQKIAARNCKIPVLQLVVYGYCTKLSQTLIVCTSLERAFIRRLSDMDNGYWRNLI